MGSLQPRGLAKGANVCSRSWSGSSVCFAMTYSLRRFDEDIYKPKYRPDACSCELISMEEGQSKSMLPNGKIPHLALKNRNNIA